MYGVPNQFYGPSFDQLIQLLYYQSRGPGYFTITWRESSRLCILRLFLVATNIDKVNQKMNSVFLRRNCMRQQQTTAKFLLAWFSSRTLPLHPLYQSTTTLYTRALPLHLSRDYHHPTIAFVARFLSNLGSFKRVYTVSRTRGYVTNTKKCEFCVWWPHGMMWWCMWCCDVLQLDGLSCRRKWTDEI